MLESFSTIGERRESSLKNPSREPPLCRMEALESLDGFQSAVELLVAALDNVGRFRTAVMDLLCPDVSCKQIAVVKNMLERLDFKRIIVVTWRPPADVTFKIVLSQIGKIEDLCFEIIKKRSVGFLASCFERLSNVLQEMNMAELDNDSGIHLSGSQTNGFIVVADQGQKFVTCIFEFYEELKQCLVVLRWR